MLAVSNGRTVAHAVLVGSEPPQSDTVWQAAKDNGFSVTVHKRNAMNEEKAVDTELVAQATEIICTASEVMNLAILSGDRDFIPLYESSDMPLNELLPTVAQLSHQDKLRLIHFLLLAVAKEEGYELQTPEIQTQENLLLKQLEATEAVVWSPHDAYGAAQTLSELLLTARREGNNA